MNINNDLVLREYLALERTRLANETTLLSYVRTGLYFLVAGSTLGHVVATPFWKLAGTPIIIIGCIIVVLGVVRYIRLRKSIAVTRKNIGHASDAFVRSVLSGKIDS